MSEIVGGRDPEKRLVSILGDQVKLSGLSPELLAAALNEALKGASPEVKAQIAEMLSKASTNSASGPADSIQGLVSQKLDDATFRFSLEMPSAPSSLKDYMRSKLPVWDEATELILALRDTLQCDVERLVPQKISATLRTDSPLKTVHEQQGLYAPFGLADAESALSLGIEAVLQARQAGIYLPAIKTGTFSFKTEPLHRRGSRVYAAAIKAGLGEGTAEVLKMLTSGGLRFQGTLLGKLSVTDDGNLNVSRCIDERQGPVGALGG